VRQLLVETPEMPVTVLAERGGWWAVAQESPIAGAGSSGGGRRRQVLRGGPGQPVERVSEPERAVEFGEGGSYAHGYEHDFAPRPRLIGLERAAGGGRGLYQEATTVTVILVGTCSDPHAVTSSVA
jgi:hypothetical protein